LFNFYCIGYVENYEFFVWVDEAEELGYFKNNVIGAAHGRNARLMEMFEDSGREEV